MSTSRRSWRHLSRAAIAATAGVLLLSTASPAAASQPTKPVDDLVNGVTDTTGKIINGLPIDEYVAKFDHGLGSQIAKVEGDLSDVKSRISALRPQGVDVTGNEAMATVAGIDVSGHQQNVDWANWWGQGKRFAYTKATESTTYTNPYFAQQYNGSYDVGMIRGAYHFATPDTSSGAAQANYFVDHGGGWSGDGKTLPGALDMEYNPYGATCYGKSQAGMAAWVRDFHDTYHARTGRWPAIYTSANWWNQCVGGAQSFGDTAPLWTARYADSVGALPSGWGVHTIWQYSSDPIDQNSFNGGYDRLQALANG